MTPLAADQRWSLDFVSDQLTDGRRFRILAVVDDCTRECLALIADTSISGRRVARELDGIVRRRGRRPDTIVSDNGTELTSNAILSWADETGVGWHYIAPGKPQQNGFIESTMADRGGDHCVLAFGDVGQSVAHPMHAASLACRAEYTGDGETQSFVRVGDHQLDALEVAFDQAFQKSRPKRLGLRRANAETDNLAPAFGCDRHGKYRRNRDDAARTSSGCVGPASN